LWEKYSKIRNARKGMGANDKRAGGLAYISERRCAIMRITFHVWKYTVTIIVKKSRKQTSRHSGK